MEIEQTPGVGLSRPDRMIRVSSIRAVPRVLAQQLLVVETPRVARELFVGVVTDGVALERIGLQFFQVMVWTLETRDKSILLVVM